MAVRQDRAQLIVEIKAAESAEYQKLIKQQKDLVRDTKKLKVGTDEYNNALADTIELNKKFSKIDINKLSIKQIQERSRQLERLKKLLPQNSKALKEMEVEQKKLNTALANARSRTRGVAQGMGKMQGAGARLVGFLKNALPLIGAFFAVGKLFAWGKQLLTLGTEIDVFDRKFKTVFGEASDIVSAYAEQNARSLGLTEQQYRTVAAAVGDLLIPMGFQRDEAAQLSSELVNLSGSLSEWSGGQKTAQEVSKIFSKALLGEREQLKDLGISIQEADVKARLAAKGQEKLTGDRLKQAKALATYELLIEKSADAQTFFANNTNSLIRKKNELKAKIQENVEVLAKKLIPIWNQVTVWGLKIVEGLIQFGIILKGIPKFIRENEKTLIALGVALIAFNLHTIKANASLLIQKVRIKASNSAKKAAIIVTKGFRAAMKGLNATIRANPIGFIIGLLISFGIIIAQVYKRSERFRNLIDSLSNVFRHLIKQAKDIPIISALIRGVTNAIKLARHAFENFGATFAGLKAAAAQAFENIKLQFVEIGISAQILAKKMSLALSIKSSTKERLRKEIEDLENIKTAAAKAGKTVGEAYSEARDEYILNTPEAKKPKGSSTKPPAKLEIEIDPGGDAAAAEKQRKKDLALALAAQKSLYDRLALLDEIERQADIERAEGNAIALAEIKQQHQQRELENKILHFEDQIALLDEFGEGESTKVLEIQAKIAALKNEAAANERERLAEIDQGRLDDLDKRHEQEDQRLREKFAQALITEQEFADLKLQNEIEQIEERLGILKELGLQDTNAFIELEVLKTEKQKEQADIRIENARFESDLKRELFDRTLDKTVSFLRGIEAENDRAFQNKLKRLKDEHTGDKASLQAKIKLLKKEQAEKKKQFNALKALQIAQVLSNLQKELSNIFTSYSSLGPIGTVLAVIAAAASTGRALQSVAKIKSASFYKGGRVPLTEYSGQRINDTPNVPTQPGGDNILAYVKRGEVVLNSDQQQHFGGPEAFRRAGVPGFVGGGLVDVNTTPTRNTDLRLGQAGGSPDLVPVTDEIRALRSAIQQLNQRPVQASVALTDIEDASEELNEIREAASL